MKHYEQAMITVILYQTQDIVTASDEAFDGCITDGTWVKGGMQQ